LTTISTPSCPAGTVAIGCGAFLGAICNDGSNGLSDTFLNGANGCTVRAFNNISNGLCNGTQPFNVAGTPPNSFNVTAIVRCINVP
jgi:hypothetical protein